MPAYQAGLGTLAAWDTYFHECQSLTYQAIVLREGHDPQLRRQAARYLPAMSQLVGGMLDQLAAEHGMPVANPEILAQLVCAVLCEAAYVIGTSDAPTQTARHAKKLVHRMVFGKSLPDGPASPPPQPYR